jgi:polar amino acid transport system permease protein
VLAGADGVAELKYYFLWSSVLASSGQLFDSLITTIQLFLLSSIGGTLIGAIGAAAILSKFKTLRWAAVAYVEGMRNSPSLVKMYFLYFGLPTIGLYPSGFVAGTLAIALHNAAYMIDIFRAAFAGIEKGQREGAMSLGLSPGARFWTVYRPQMTRRALPAIGNCWSEIVKDTTVTSALSVHELYYTFASLVALNQRTYEFLIVVAAIYLILTSAVGGSFRFYEKLLSRSDRAAR